MTLKYYSRLSLISRKCGLFYDDVSRIIGYVFQVILFRESDEIVPDAVKVVRAMGYTGYLLKMHEYIFGFK